MLQCAPTVFFFVSFPHLFVIPLTPTTARVFSSLPPSLPRCSAADSMALFTGQETSAQTRISHSLFPSLFPSVQLLISSFLSSSFTSSLYTMPGSFPLPPSLAFLLRFSTRALPADKDEKEEGGGGRRRRGSGRRKFWS